MDEESLLARACRRRDLFQVQALLRDKADPNLRDRCSETPLLQAAAQGDLDVVALLLSHGADPSLRAPTTRRAEADSQLSASVRQLFKLFTKGLSTDQRLKLLNSLPALDPGAYAQLRNRLGLGPKHIQRATAAAKVVREATADHEVTLYIKDPLKPQLVLQPYESPSAVVILLHGLLQSGQMMERLARDLSRGLPSVRFIAPTASSIPSVFGLGPAWFDTTKQYQPGVLPQQLEASKTELLDLIESEMSLFELSPSRFIFVGFSAGSSLAAFTALVAPWQIGGLALLGTHGPPQITSPCRRPPTLQCHGAEDSMVSISNAEASVAKLRAHGCEVQFSIYQGVGHTISEGMLVEIPTVQTEVKTWIKMRLYGDSNDKETTETSEKQTTHEDLSNDPKPTPLDDSVDAELGRNVSQTSDPQQSSSPASSSDAVCGCQESGWSSSTDTPRRGFASIQTTEADLVALLLAYDLPLLACQVTLARFAGDVDKCLEFLLDTEEGQKLCVTEELAPNEGKTGDKGPEVAGRLILRNTFIELEDPGSLDEGTDGPLGRARASSDGCLFESSRFDEDVTQEVLQAPVDLNVAIALTGASCLNTPRSDVGDGDVGDSMEAKGLPPVSSHVANLHFQPAWGTTMPKPAVNKEELQRLSDEVAQLVKQNKQLRSQITSTKDPITGFETGQEVGATWMAYPMQGQCVGGCDQISYPGYVNAFENREADLTYSPAWTEQSTCDADGGTSVMLRNLPNNYTRSKLLEMLDNEGFANQYNFVYLPIDFQTEASLGYAFVNMVDSSHVPKLQEKLTGFKKWRVPSKKICEVRLCGPWPDLEAHIERYRNSSVMHHTVPEEFKPALFENGKQIPFPKPSKAPKAPQLRRVPGPVGLGATATMGSSALSPGLVQRYNS